MQRRRKTRCRRPRRETGTDYTTAIHRYLLFLLAACLIVSLYTGPGIFVVWVLTALVLLATYR